MLLQYTKRVVYASPDLIYVIVTFHLWLYLPKVRIEKKTRGLPRLPVQNPTLPFYTEPPERVRPAGTNLSAPWPYLGVVAVSIKCWMSALSWP